MNRLIKSAGIAWMLVTMAFLSCSDDDDIIGLNGNAKYGSIKVTIEGTRPDGEAYTLTRNFRFTPAAGPNFSHVQTYEDGGDPYRYFFIYRLFSAVNEDQSGYENDNEVYLSMYMQEGGEPAISDNSFWFETSVMTGGEFFVVEEYFNINDEDITSYSFNEKTGKLSFKFKKELSAEQSYSGFPATVTVNVSATAFEQMDSPEDQQQL
jgi:hypothetical protein